MGRYEKGHLGKNSTPMDGEYSQERAELRKLRRRMFRVAIVGVAVAVLVSVTGVVRGTVATALGVIFFAAWVAVLIRFFLIVGDYSYWPCPPVWGAISLRYPVVWQVEQSIRASMPALRSAEMGGVGP
jgi:hypothetical protein